MYWSKQNGQFVFTLNHQLLILKCIVLRYHAHTVVGACSLHCGYLKIRIEIKCGIVSRDIQIIFCSNIDLVFFSFLDLHLCFYCK